MRPEETYEWEVGTKDGLIYRQYDGDGNEVPFPDIDPKSVVKLCYNPRANGLPPHILTFGEGLEFVRRFGRGFIKVGVGSESRNYAFCTVTNQCRFYLLPDGRVIITPKDYELRRV